MNGCLRKGVRRWVLNAFEKHSRYPRYCQRQIKSYVGTYESVRIPWIYRRRRVLCQNMELLLFRVMIKKERKKEKKRNKKKKLISALSEQFSRQKKEINNNNLKGKTKELLSPLRVNLVGKERKDKDKDQKKKITL